MKIPTIKDLDLKDKRVFLRADLNVPLEPFDSTPQVLQDYRLKAILPSIDYIQKNGGKVILATHIGRPKPAGQTDFFDEDLTTKLLMPWFKEHGYQIQYAKNLIEAQTFSHLNFSKILLFENLRFFNGEKGDPKSRAQFAKNLRNLADIYVNDAFALIHRQDTSVTLLPALFKPGNKSFGFLVEKELTELEKLKHNIEQPFVLILGGNKIKSKIPMLENFLTMRTENRPSSILIGGAIAYTFLKAQGFQVGRSLVDGEFIEFAKNFLNDAKEQNINILLARDHLVIQENKDDILSQEENFKDVFETKSIPADGTCIDIGPEAIKEFTRTIAQAKTIFINGTMGIYTEKDSSHGSEKILHAIANSNAYKVAGGGDCIAAIYKFNLQNKFDFLSTGGGATLAFLGAKDAMQDLPGLKEIYKIT